MKNIVGTAEEVKRELRNSISKKKRHVLFSDENELYNEVLKEYDCIRCELGLSKENYIKLLKIITPLHIDGYIIFMKEDEHSEKVISELEYIGYSLCSLEIKK